MIHVAVIVGSYGPFTISMILGVVSLILMILVNKRNRELLNINVKELVLINEMSMTIGLVMLTIGNFWVECGQMRAGVDIGAGILKKHGR
ncbi:MAG: hypothetical protein CM15mP36_13050 [Flavobacteriales bacterium]|nr:MAG: hypothetical protein CM15mP36_13050 [Flavobacteriales bacterium]